MREIAIVLCLLAFLVPVGAYCLMLASINRRARPLILGGGWDSAGLIFATSGFVTVSVPMLLAELYGRMSGLGDSVPFLAILLHFWYLWVIYYLMLVSGAALMILWRSHKTMIYNIDVEQFQKAFDESTANLGLGITVEKPRLVLGPVTPASADNGAFTAAPASPPPDGRYAELTLERFPGMCHVTMHWDNYAPDVRRDIEEQLERNLELLSPMDNPAAGWFLSVSGLIFGAVTMLIVAIGFFVLFAQR